MRNQRPKKLFFTYFSQKSKSGAACWENYFVDVYDFPANEQAEYLTRNPATEFRKPSLAICRTFLKYME